MNFNVQTTRLHKLRIMNYMESFAQTCIHIFIIGEGKCQIVETGIYAVILPQSICDGVGSSSSCCCCGGGCFFGFMHIVCVHVGNRNHLNVLHFLKSSTARLKIMVISKRAACIMYLVYWILYLDRTFSILL